MEDVGLLQPESAIGFELLVDEKWEVDAGLAAKGARIVHTAEADREQASAPGLDLCLMRAQLRDVLTAEDSTPVAQENHHRRLLCPDLTETNAVAIDVGQLQRSKPAAESVGHRDILWHAN